VALSAGITREMLWTVFVETDVSSFFETFVGLLELSPIPFSTGQRYRDGLEVELGFLLSICSTSSANHADVW
jgi:hypothetical protein